MPKLPKFDNEEEIFDFFETHSAADYMEGTREVKAPVTDRRSKKEITTLRIDSQLKQTLQLFAKRKGIRYQTLINMWLTEKAREEILHLEKKAK